MDIRAVGGVARALVAAGLVAGGIACTEDVTVPSASGAADSFMRSWSEQDAAAMVASFSDRSATRWPVRRLERTLRRVVDDGRLTTVEARVEGGVRMPEISTEEDLVGLDAEVPFSVTYTSRASAEPVALEGEMRLVYERRAASWSVAWAKKLLWPGIARAGGFEIRSKWSARAPILDRDGRRLARGPSAARNYPFGALAGSTVGYVGRLTRAAARTAGEHYAEGDLAGASGLEAAFERRLAGIPTTSFTVVDGDGRRIETLGRRSGKRPRPVRTTLDADVQRAAEGAYGGTVGGAVVLEPGSGDLLAIVSSYPIDPNAYVGASDFTPFNRALSGLYPPGSSMKVVTASAALDSGVVSASTPVTGPRQYKGVRNFESGVFGSIPFSKAVQFSVNTAFAQVAEDLGAKRLTRYARAFGFNSDPDMALESARSSFPEPADLGELMWGSIGQAAVVATPLEMATVAATIANEGVRMEPRIALHQESEGERTVSRRAARTMTTLMQAVVEGGTGVAAAVPGVSVAGKTGTAEVDVDGKRKNHAWFVSFAPAQAPEVAVSVVSEYGGIGGEVAAPLAGSILRAVLPMMP